MQDIAEILKTLQEENRLRRIPGEYHGDALDLLSNDYLGLGQREAEFHEEFLTRFGDASFTSSASRLLSRKQKYHVLLENKLEELYGKPALLFNSGYHANTGIIAALAALPSSLMVADKLIHASAIDGLRLGGGDYLRFRHNDLKSLEKILEKNAGKYRNIFVIVESVYSMDGDLADIRALVSLRKKYPEVKLIVDEAHGFGCFGKRGLGVCEELGLIEETDVIIGTLGKAAASAGAFAVTDRDIKDYLINSARSFIFSTAMPPAQQAWSLLMIEKITGMEEERKRLRELGERVRLGIEAITGRENPSRSQIIPLMTGDAAKAIALAQKLRESGFDCLPIRRPTVAAGTERVRLSLNAALTPADTTKLLSAIQKEYNTGNR